MNSLKKFIFGTKAVPYIDVISEVTREGLNKAFIPKYLYKPPFGFPRFANIDYIRYLAKTPYVEMCIDTILKEIAAIEWDVVPNPDIPERVGDDLFYEEDGGFKAEVEAEINHIKSFLENPNTNKESFEDIFVKMAYRDVLEVNTGIVNKVFNFKEEMVELVARDGATFTKNPDIHGMYTDRVDILIPKKIVENAGEAINPFMHISSGLAREQAAYFQYGWISGPVPVPFGKREIVWMQNMLRSDDIYAYSPVQLLAKALQMLLYHIDGDLEYYNDNNVPKGIIGIDASDADEIKSFKQQWYDAQRSKDEFGNWKKMMHKVPILNYIPKFERIEFSSEEIQLIEKQKWYSKMVWACYDEQTEILTDNGWKYFKDLKDEKVARVNPYDLKTDFVLPIDKQVYDFDGDLYHYKHCNVDLMVTPDHKMLFKSERDFEEDSKLDWKTCLAKDEKTMYVPQSVDFDGENIDEMNFTSENKYVSNEHKETEKFSISGDDFVSFMGFWLGDGWVESDNNRIVLCASSVYPENVKFVESLLKKMGVDYKLKVSKANGVIQGKEVNVNGEMYYFRFSNKAFRDYLLQFKKSHDKFIPDVIKNCSSNQKKLFFKSYLMTDGCEYAESGRNTTFFSMSKRLIDDLQEMFVKDGQSCNINEQSGGYNLTLRKKQYCLIDKKVHISKVNYVGKVYDVTVPEHHFLVVRRNGRVVVSGNCFGVTATELGYTEDGQGVSNQIVQSKVFKKKAINPALRMIGNHLNREVLSEFEYVVDVPTGKKSLPMPKYVFRFNTFDIDDEKSKAELHKLWVDMGRKSINEIRISEGEVPVDWGDDDPRSGAGNSGNNFYVGNGETSKEDFGKKEEVAQDTDEDLESPKTRDVTDNNNRNESRVSNQKSKKKSSKSDEGVLSSELISFLDDKEEEIKSYLEKELGDDVIKQIKSDLESISGEDYSSIEVKSIDTLIRALKSILGFEAIKQLVFNTIRTDFLKGAEEGEDKINESKPFNYVPDRDAIDYIGKYTFDNVKGMSDDVANDLRVQLQIGFMNGEGIAKLKSRVVDVFGVSKTRAKAIARTETSRAHSFGKLSAFKSSGMKALKWLLMTDDNRTSDVSKALNKKYGSEDKAIPLDENFKVSVVVGKKTLLIDQPCGPFHVNERCELMIVPVLD